MSVLNAPERLVPFLFNAGMAVFFLFAFFFSQLTGHWLGTGGLYVMTLEFISVFIILFSAQALRKDTGWTGGESAQWLPLALAALFAVLWGFALNQLETLWYFAGSMGVKIYAMKKSPDAKAEGIQAAYAVLLLTLGAFIALALSPTGLFFAEKTEEISNNIRQTAPGVEGLAVDNPFFTAIWGSVYFLGMAVVALRPAWLPLERLAGE